MTEDEAFELIKKSNGNLPLMNMNWKTSTEMVQLFAQYGTNFNTQNFSGRTALMNTSSSGNLKVVTALLESGANVLVQDKYKNSALDLAHSKEIKQILIAYGAVEKIKA